MHELATASLPPRLWLVALIFFLPVLWIFLAAFKTNGELGALAAEVVLFADD